MVPIESSKCQIMATYWKVRIVQIGVVGQREEWFSTNKSSLLSIHCLFQSRINQLTNIYNAERQLRGESPAREAQSHVSDQITP